MRYEFHPEAEREFGQAVEYYENSEHGLGYDFANEVHLAIQKILSYPKAWPKISGDVRRCLLNRFPYGLIYHIEGDTATILAVMHLHRHPEYWQNRG